AGRCCAAWRGCTSPRIPSSSRRTTPPTRPSRTSPTSSWRPQKRPTRPRRRRSVRPSCGSWSGSSCCAWWTSTGW
ncbi:putative transcriptional regulator, partial [Dysosmobacter welbionis]